MPPRQLLRLLATPTRNKALTAKTDIRRCLTSPDAGPGSDRMSTPTGRQSARFS